MRAKCREGWASTLFCRSLQSTAPATKNKPEASEVLPHRIIIMSQIKFDDSFTKRDLEPFKTSCKFTKYCACQKRLWFTHAWQRFSNVQKVPRLPRGWNSVRCPTPVTKNDVSDFKMSRKCHACLYSKNEHGALVKRALRKKRGPPATVSCETSFENGRWGNFCAVRVTKFAGHAGYHLRWPPGPNPDRKNPSAWPPCLGEWWTKEKGKRMQNAYGKKERTKNKQDNKKEHEKKKERKGQQKRITKKQEKERKGQQKRITKKTGKGAEKEEEDTENQEYKSKEICGRRKQNEKTKAQGLWKEKG